MVGRPAKRAKFDCTKTVTITIKNEHGHKIQTFQVYPEPLFRSSGYFAPNDGRDTKLTWHTPDTFATYLNLLYTGQINVKEHDQEREDKTGSVVNHEFTDSDWEKLVDLYYLTAFVMDYESMNETMKEIVIVLHTSSPPLSIVRQTYAKLNSLMEGGDAERLEKLFVDYVVHSKASEGPKLFSTEGNAYGDIRNAIGMDDFMVNIADAFIKRKDGETTRGHELHAEDYFFRRDPWDDN